jgi:hypothetical protein
MCPAFLPVAPETASLASRIRIFSPAMPLLISSQAVRAPEIPDPIMRYWVYRGTLAELFSFRCGNERVVWCQCDRFGEWTGSEGCMVKFSRLDEGAHKINTFGKNEIPRN